MVAFWLAITIGRWMSLGCLLMVGLVNAKSALPDGSIPLPKRPAMKVVPPHMSASAYILLDTYSGKVLAEKNADKKMPPASLTKMMTLYVISSALHNGAIALDDRVRISRQAWQASGSKMFVKEGEFVTVKDLIQGIVVQSGNDACIAMAEYVAGSREEFVDLMNQQAEALGMKNSHFSDSFGLAKKEHYSTPRDMAILGQALYLHFPENYSWYKQKWFTYHGIKQPNRNRLLWRNDYVDGIKTGHTDEAGYCLVASAYKDGMRLVAVTMGSPTDNARALDNQRLLNFGYRFFESHSIYKGGKVISKARIWLGQDKFVPLGISSDLHVTIPSGQYKNLKANMEMFYPIKAPIRRGQQLGQIVVRLNNNVIQQKPIVALQNDNVGGLWTRFSDYFGLVFHRIFKG